MIESSGKVQSEIRNLLSVEQAWYYSVVPLKLEDDALHLLADEGKNNRSFQSELEIVLGKKLVIHLEQSSKIEELLLGYYPRSLQKPNHDQGEKGTYYSLNTGGNNFLENLVKEAKDLHSSDIHIETYGEKCRIRLGLMGF